MSPGRAEYPYGVRACAVEAADPPATVDLGGADEWRVLVTWRGTPCGYLELPSPGSSAGPGILSAALARHADGLAAWEQFVDGFRRRMGVQARQPPAASCSVVVCTRRRPDYLAHVLDGLRRLDPPADEIVVVDNDPGEKDCRAEAERAGVRYVREDRPGLDRARNAGLRVAGGTLVAFTDDDCLPARGWLRALPELFSEPTVAAVTGPAFAYTLDTPAQVRFEDQGGHRRGLRRRTVDWTVLTPIAASRAGAGLNMIFRRSALDPLGDIFPPELDAGTPTESGGDMYALYKLLRAGHRIVYDPGTYVLHQHRPDVRSLHGAIRGYGIGVSAVLTKLVVEERELAAPTVWYWLWWLYVDALRRRLLGRGDPVEVRIGWDYLSGGLLGPAAWFGSRRRFARNGADPPPAPAPSAPTTATPIPARAAGAGDGCPAISAIIAATGPGTETRCLEALSRESEHVEALEVIVIGAGRLERGPAADRMTVRRVDADPTLGARNAGARHARGEVLLFLDADTVPEPGCVVSHLNRHAASGRGRLVVGHCPPHPTRPGLAALWETRRRQGRLERTRAAAAMTFAEVRCSNVSLPRASFEELGGFDADFEHMGRQAWELGVRALQHGLEVAYEPAAGAVEHVGLATREALATARREGRGDAMLESRHPVVSPSLPALARRRRRGRLLGRSGATRGAALALRVLERLRARRLWLRLFELTRRAAYERGTLDAGGRRPAAAAAKVLRVELDSDEPIVMPRVAPPVVELALHGEPVGRLMPTGGQWDGSLADRAAAAVGDRMRGLARQRPPAFEETPRGRRLSGCAVVLGPARRPGDDAHRAELEAAGATVELVAGDPRRHWDALDRAIRRSPAQIVALPLPGVAPTAPWLSGARLALEGDRVAMALGAGLAPSAPLEILFLAARRLLPAPYPILGRPSQYLVVRRELYAALGGIDPAAARLGHQAVVLDLMDRALDAGLVIGYRDVPGLEPTHPSQASARRAAWRRHEARGGLMLRRARRIGRAGGTLWLGRHGALPLAAKVWRGLRGGDPDGVRAAGAAAAFVSGCLRAAAAGRRRGRPGAELVAAAPKRPGPRAP